MQKSLDIYTNFPKIKGQRTKEKCMFKLSSLRLPIAIGMVFTLAACNNDANLKDRLAEILKENPEIVTKSIEQNPAVYVEAIQKAVGAAQADLAKKKEEEEKKRYEESFNNPLQPNIRSDEAIRGPKDAPLTLVEYSDFECPFCFRGYETVNELMEKYEGKIRFVYKHLPLSFHPQAMIAAQYFEAIRIQSPEKAFEFHDEIFKNQKKLQNGEAFLKSIAKNLKVDMKKLEADVNSEAVMARIAEDQKEAEKFGIQGTPGFLINGIPVKGAYPANYFDEIIKTLKEKGKVNI